MRVGGGGGDNREITVFEEHRRRPGWGVRETEGGVKRKEICFGACGRRRYYGPILEFASTGSKDHASLQCP